MEKFATRNKYCNNSFMEVKSQKAKCFTWNFPLGRKPPLVITQGKFSGETRGGRSLCLVYCSTPIGLNLANYEIFTGGLSHTSETILIFDTSVRAQNGGHICHTAAGVKTFSALSP